MAMRASRPAVDCSGSLMPNLNAPQSGLLYFAQPCGSAATLLIMSCQDRSPLGQPSASAIGFGMARTDGVRARLGCRSGIIRSAIAAVDARRTHALESGTPTSGGTPALLSP